MEHPLSHDTIRGLAAQQPTPFYAYSRAELQRRAGIVRNLRLPYGYTPRFAVKANPHPGVIALFDAAGLHFDASSSYEAGELLRLGIAGEKISLSSQQPAHNLPELLAAGVHYVATSMHQLELFAAAAPAGTPVGLRVNIGSGSGHAMRTTTAGPAASFGLWHEYLEDALQLARQHGITITKMHTHIGSGADPAKLAGAMQTTLAVAARMPDVTVLDMGGGYKVRRVKGEHETDLAAIVAGFAAHLTAFAEETGRQLHLEIEPGTWLVAHAGALITTVTDIVDTGKDGFTFLRTDTGMNDFLRPTLYGAQHEIELVANQGSEPGGMREYVVVGHNCESGDILTTQPRDPETVRTEPLPEAHIGDLLAVRDTGAYCGSLRAKGYNSFPDAAELIV